MALETVLCPWHSTLHRPNLLLSGAIGYDFGALDGRATQLGESHQNIMYVIYAYLRCHLTHSIVSVMSGVRGKIDLIFEALVPYIPQWVLELAIHSPTDAFRALLHNRTVSAEVSHELIRVRQENAAMNAEAGKDLLTVMGKLHCIHMLNVIQLISPSIVRANATAKGSQKMSNLEMQQQIPSLMIAGQDTTVWLEFLQLTRGLMIGLREIPYLWHYLSSPKMPSFKKTCGRRLWRCMKGITVI